jgi:hypothetical protein
MPVCKNAKDKYYVGDELPCHHHCVCRPYRCLKWTALCRSTCRD